MAAARRYMLTPHSLYAAVSVGLETSTILTVLNRLSKLNPPGAARLNKGLTCVLSSTDSAATGHRRVRARVHTELRQSEAGAPEEQVLCRVRLPGGAPKPSLGLDTDAVELTARTLLSHPITQKFNFPANYSRM
eukprot:1178343-Prorocentrum_minimum.AAC.2